MHRAITALIEAQESWAKPLGEQVQHWLAGVFDAHAPAQGPAQRHLARAPAAPDAHRRAGRRDDGRRPAGRDRPGPRGRRRDRDRRRGDDSLRGDGPGGRVDTYGRPQVYATVHATLMASSLAAYTGSLVLRIGPRALRPLAVAASMAGYAALDRRCLRRRRARLPAGQPGRPPRVRLDLDQVEGAGRERGARRAAREGEGRQRPDRPVPRRGRRADPGPPRGVRPRGRPARQGHARRRVRRVPVARLPVPDRRRAPACAAPPSTISRCSRSARRRTAGSRRDARRGRDGPHARGPLAALRPPPRCREGRGGRRPGPGARRGAGARRGRLGQPRGPRPAGAEAVVPAPVPGRPAGRATRGWASDAAGMVEAVGPDVTRFRRRRPRLRRPVPVRPRRLRRARRWPRSARGCRSRTASRRRSRPRCRTRRCSRCRACGGAPGRWVPATAC